MGRLTYVHIPDHVSTQAALMFGERATDKAAHMIAVRARELASERAKRSSVANRIHIRVKRYEGVPIDRRVEVSVKGRNGAEIASLLEFGGWMHPRSGKRMAGMHFMRDAAIG